MSHDTRRSVRAATAVAGAVLTALVLSCAPGRDTRSPVQSLQTLDQIVALQDFPGYVRVCKESGPVGSYTFTISVAGGGDFTLPNGPQTTLDFNGELVCAPMYVPVANETWTPGLTANITVTELVPADMRVTEIKVFSPDSLPIPGYLYSVFNTNTITVTVALTDRLKIQYNNVPNPRGRLGDYVWSDLNNNGIQDAGEPGIPNVPVTLSGTTTGSTTTNGSGFYIFENLPLGDYTVTVGTPAGMAPTTSNAGSNDELDSNGSPTSTTLTAADFEDLSLDFGFVAACQDQSAMNYGQALPCVYPPPPCPAGSFTYTFAPNGDLLIRYDQFPAPNDNSYGINAVGWPNGHTFGNLTGSDHAGFQLRDGGGVVRLSFNVDYLSAVASAPSGYASLGVNGGDGHMITGTATGITATTSLANNLNNINIPGLFNAAHVQQFGSVNVLANSPPTDAAHQTYNISDPLLAGWDFHNTYFVTISAAKLASIGFNPATWAVEPNPDQLHNSPAKPCPPAPAGPCNLTVTKYEVKDKQLKITIGNLGTSDVFLSDVVLNWPAATNGKLMKVKIGGDVVYDNPDIVGGSAHLTAAMLTTDMNKRKIEKGKAEVLTFEFERNADSNLANYLLTVAFGDNCVLNLLPK